MLDWRAFALLPPEELARHDVAEYNLACAAGFPEAARYRPEVVLSQLDYWAREVKRFTDKNLPRYRRSRHSYKNSEAFFRAVAMITVLERDLGLHYNPAKIPADAPFDANDTFITGAVLGQGGTCASLSVVVAAVGRRLGYPIKLVTCQGGPYEHCFSRWDDPDTNTRFNIESTGRGLGSEPDDYYRRGRYARTPEVEEGKGLLLSWTPRQELAAFLRSRAFLLEARGCMEAAGEAFLWRLAVAPEFPTARITIACYLERWHQGLRARAPTGFPKLHLLNRPSRQFPEAVPLDFEEHFHYCRVAERLLSDPIHEARWWGPLRRCEHLRESPAVAEVTYTATGFNVAFRMGRPLYYDALGWSHV